MRFGLYLNPQTPGSGDDARVIDEVLGQVDLAADVGFDSVWLTEHHFTGYNVYSDPVVLATAISQRRNLDLGFSIAVAPFHHPIRFVTQCNLLDNLCGGKLTIGVGPGNSPVEFAGYGRDVTQRHAMLAEFVQIAEQAWAAGPEGFAYEGQFWNGEIKGRIIPAPRQKPHPTIAWGTTTADTVERLGRERQAWLIAGSFDPEKLEQYYRRYLMGMDSTGIDDAGRDAVWAKSAYVMKVYLCGSGEDWRETLEPYIDTFVRKNLQANFAVDTITQAQFDQNKEFFYRGFFAGRPDDLVEKLRPYASLGLGTVMLWINFGHLPDELVRNTILRFAAEVAPALKQVGPMPNLYEHLRSGEDRPLPIWTRTADGYAWVEPKLEKKDWAGTV
jgi:alkanesulfonate monooxygenase SsuD/methylene tetrahydromethanopterin reductase-like flavin-dependent oxidoreductase (luciferase family)